MSEFHRRIIHVDMDAFFASVEQLDFPELRGKPVVVGGSKDGRGVVAAASYEARVFGVRSAIPSARAFKLCPQAVVLKPRHSYYSQVARQIRGFMQALTPLVEPLSLDEAYLDLSGTERMHHKSPARTMAALQQRIEREVGITVSVGLSGNKFLAKLASELDKPRGFAVIGMAEAKSFLRDKPIAMMRGAGKVMQARLEREWQLADLVEHDGAAGGRLEDAGAVSVGAGERTAHVPEQLRLEKIGR